ncbi:MAG: hypothetical protein LBU77_00560, partial [Clostridiales bacterium]|nr:hypothetical protein [Clostridiales bacterium]
MKFKKALGLFLSLSLLLSSTSFVQSPFVYAAEPQPQETAITEEITDVFAENIPSEEIGNIRIQVLSDTLARIELKGPNGYEDRTSYHIVNRENWPGTAASKLIGETETQIMTENYTVIVPNDADSLDGVYITDKSDKEVWRYSTLPSSSVYLPAPGATPKAWAIADNPRAIPADWGYRVMPEENTEFPEYNGWDTTNNAPDMFVFLPDGDAKQLRKDFTGLTGESDF